MPLYTKAGYAQAIKTLIDAASIASGNQAGLAARLRLTPQRLNDYKGGRVPCPLHVRVNLALIAGQNARDELVTAFLESIQDKPNAAELAEALAPEGGGSVDPTQTPRNRPTRQKRRTAPRQRMPK